MEPMAFFRNPSEGASDILRSRARRRERFVRSMSFVASSPVCLRAMSVSVTCFGLEPKFCHKELTEAKPERRAMRDIPITPILSRQASIRLCSLPVALWCAWIPKMPCPIHQNPNIQVENPAICKAQASLKRPFPPPLNFQPAEDMKECSSRNGITMTSRTSRVETVTWSATLRAAGSRVLEISQRINSASTADRAMVVEKVTADML